MQFKSLFDDLVIGSYRYQLKKDLINPIEIGPFKQYLAVANALYCWLEYGIIFIFLLYQYIILGQIANYYHLETCGAYR